MAASSSHEMVEEPCFPANPTSHLWLWRTLALILAFYVIAQTGERLLWFSKLQPGAGTFAVGVKPAPQFAPGYVEVDRVSPDGPMAKAGVVKGDHIKFDQFPVTRRANMAGDVATFTLDHEGVKKQLSVTAIPTAGRASGSRETLNLLIAIPYFISALFGAFIIYRGRNKPSLVMLGVALSAQSLTSSSLGMWSNRLLDWESFALVGEWIIGLSSMAFMAFALLFYEEFVGAVRRWVWRFVAVYVVLLVLIVAIEHRLMITITTLPMIGNGRGLYLVLNWSGWIAALLCMIHGWRSCLSETRRRYALLIVALFMLAATRVLAEIHLFLTRDLVGSNIIWDGVLICLGTALAAPLFVYAILRHKVFDIGFAINRTLIYGVISFGLLLVFGLIEWGSERLLPHESLGESAVVNAGVALTIFLVFHRVRDFVEHHVERLLFRSWHDNEERLRLFVKEAGFIGKPEKLMIASVAAISRFAGGAKCAFYVRVGDDFVRTEGILARVCEVIDGDDPLSVTLRANPLPLEPSGGSIALALPMSHRAELDGYILLDQKLSGDSYRPDEIELLGWAAQQIGLDLHALKVGQLQAQTAGQGQEIALLKAQLQIALAGGMAQRA